jgi:hypothetical protein
MEKTDDRTAYRLVDLLPAEEGDILGAGRVLSSFGLRRVAGPAHMMRGGGTMCGIPLAEVEVMSGMFSPLPGSCGECVRVLAAELNHGDEVVDVSVTAHADNPDAEFLAENREGVGDFSVFYGDEEAHDHQDLVERSVGFLSSFPGIEKAVHEDRELIYGWGRNVDLVSPHDALVQWWKDQL